MPTIEAAMLPFDFQPRTRFVCAPGALARLGELAAECGMKRVLVASDPGIIAAGHTQRGIDALAAAGLQVFLFDGVRENPTTREVEAGLQFARECNIDGIVGLGGGSSMDCGKGINFLYTNGGRMQDYWGVGKAAKTMLPMIAAPTTAGTGSEAQSFALISDAETHVKMACGDPKAACRAAILDVELTLTQPRAVAVVTGIDAVSHALETYVTTRRTPVSRIFSREAWRLLANHFSRVLESPDDLEARAAMQWGACLAGLAIENSMLGAAHALANPLTARFGVVHGRAIALMLPHVIRFNASECEAAYTELWNDVDTNLKQSTHANAPASHQLAEFVAQLAQRAELAATLSEVGVTANDLNALANEAAKQWTGGFNPIPVNETILREIYQRAL